MHNGGKPLTKMARRARLPVCFLLHAARSDEGRERMAAERNYGASRAVGARRRARQVVRRRRRVEFSLSEEEYARVRAAARDAGLANGAYAARATWRRFIPPLFRPRCRSAMRWPS
jgi:hypothetical protein